MTKTSTILTTTSLIALLSGFGSMGCGGSEKEPVDQSQTAGLTSQPSSTPVTQQAVGAEAHGERGHGEHRFGPPSPEKMLERFDTNKNGQLEAAELPPRMQEHLGEIDTSGDAIVSKAELEAHFKAKFAEHAAKFAERAKERFDKHDTNHDGMLDQSEVGAEHWARLSVADANGDQKLTPDELKAAFESGKIQPPMRGEGGRHWDHDGPAAPPAAGAAAPPAPAQ